MQHLRDAIGDLGANASIQDVVRLALKKAHPGGGAGSVPSQHMTLGVDPHYCIDRPSSC